MKFVVVACLLMLSGLNSYALDDEKKASNRIDFSGSQVRGQSNKSGAVYLMNRKKNEIRSMLKKRKDYRKEIFQQYPEFQLLNK